MGFPIPLFVLGALLNRISPGDFEEAVLKALGPRPAGLILLAAVSGGADSTAMLAALSRLRERGNFSLMAAHVEHGIRPAGESRGDARAALALCAGLGLPCRVLSIRPGKIAAAGRRRGIGVEAAARHFRYRALIREALRLGAGAIVTAHTADDNLELCLMRVLRGSGPGGLGRMPVSRSITTGKGSLFILRPLLGLYRGDIESYLAALGLSWRSDATNSDERFLRNRVRAKLVPLLDKEFPGWRRGLEALGDTQNLAAGFIDGEARRRLGWEWSGGTGPGRELRSGDGFFDQPLIIREEALFQALNLFQGSRSGAAVKRRNLRRFAEGEIRDLDLGFCRVSAGGGKGRVSIFRRTGGERGFSLLIKGPGLYKLEGIAGLGSYSGAALRVLERENSSSCTGKERGFFAALPLVLRPFHPGDGAGELGRFNRKGLKPRGGKEISGMRTQSVPVPCFQDMLVAQDAAGPAALIGLSPRGVVMLWNRETREGEDSFFCGIGGIDA
ncbi:MAG: tRNA lysidine(34) synthetase TilS [Treponema sp.]|jgi:tRNA(Ile)-lysidine synthase|nr:tRNA lysidine(34) synthetase TilS [Treponema sp.]